MAMNLSLAIEDVATASNLFQKAQKAGVGRVLPL
jgi:ornithine cyclodeaminase/alanine dehydrogenase-like protein (mu-crystallin family)